MSDYDGNEMTPEEALRHLRAEADSIGRRVAQLEVQIAPKRGSRSRQLAQVIAGSAVISAALLIGVSAGAQQSEQLVTFQAGTPARADEINGNFALLKRWIERKVGDVDADCTDGNCSASVQGNVSASGTVAAQRVDIGGNEFRFGANERGDGGRALEHGPGDTLLLNSTGDFSGGTSVGGNLSVGGTLSVGGQALGDLTDGRVRNWVRGHCYIEFGLRRNCEREGCANGGAPERRVRVGATGSSCVDGASDDDDERETWCNGGWGAVGSSDALNSDDVIYARFECN